MSTQTVKTLVLGIGNVLWADEGFGVRAVEALHQRYAFPDDVELMDGGTQGLLLLEPVCSAQRVLVFDAIDYRLAPGTLRVFRGADVPEWSDTVMSLHQATFQELLSLARLRGRYPDQLTLIGVQPCVLDDLGGSLSDPVRARIDEAVHLAVVELADWGIAATDRQGQPAEALSPPALALEGYEKQRPSAAAACRVGDPRFLAQVHGKEIA